MSSRSKPVPAEPLPANPQRGDRATQGNVQLEFNGSQWLPLRNAHNYPKLYNADGTRKTQP